MVTSSRHVSADVRFFTAQSSDLTGFWDEFRDVGLYERNGRSE